MEATEYEGWTILELMGHRRLAGWLSSQQIGGAHFLRLDVPGEPGAPAKLTQFYRPEAVYCITPTTEAIARALAERAVPEPVSAYELPKLAAPRSAKGPLAKGDMCPNCDSDVLHQTASLDLTCPSCGLELSFGEEAPPIEEDDAF